MGRTTAARHGNRLRQPTCCHHQGAPQPAAAVAARRLLGAGRQGRQPATANVVPPKERRRPGAPGRAVRRRKNPCGGQKAQTGNRGAAGPPPQTARAERTNLAALPRHPRKAPTTRQLRRPTGSGKETPGPGVRAKPQKERHLRATGQRPASAPGPGSRTLSTHATDQPPSAKLNTGK